MKIMITKKIQWNKVTLGSYKTYQPFPIFWMNQRMKNVSRFGEKVIRATLRPKKPAEWCKIYCECISIKFCYFFSKYENNSSRLINWQNFYTTLYIQLVACIWEMSICQEGSHLLVKGYIIMYRTTFNREKYVVLQQQKFLTC